jgi:hypothetical protein
MLLLEEENKILHLRLKAYLQAFMFGEEKVHWDVTILCSSSLPYFDISMYGCCFCFCLDLSMLLNFWIWSCMFNGVKGRHSFQCCHHHLFLALIISLLSLFFMDFPSVQNRIYIKIYLYLKIYEITFRTCGHSSKTEFKQGSYVGFTSALRAVQNWFQDVLHSVIRA